MRAGGEPCGGRREGEEVEREAIAHRKVSLLNKNTETKEEQIPLLEVSDRRAFSGIIHGILFIINVLLFRELRISQCMDEEGKGFGSIRIDFV